VYLVSWQRFKPGTSRIQRSRSSLHSLIHFLPFLLKHLKLPYPELYHFLTTINSNDFLCSFIASRQGQRRKHNLSTVEVCLLNRCLAMDVLLLLVFAPPGICLCRRCPAMGIYLTISSTHNYLFSKHLNIL
jgi:hypothetical protein